MLAMLVLLVLVIVVAAVDYLLAARLHDRAAPGSRER